MKFIIGIKQVFDLIPIVPLDDKWILEGCRDNRTTLHTRVIGRSSHRELFINEAALHDVTSIRFERQDAGVEGQAGVPGRL